MKLIAVFSGNAFRMACMKNEVRRRLLKNGFLVGIGSFIAMEFKRLAVAKSTLKATPAEVEGPFYPVRLPRDQDYDLTHITGRTGVAQGDPILVSGRVMDTAGRSVEGARVEIWQANAAGRYLHPKDSNPAKVDPDFQGFAAVVTDVSGAFLFKTVFPGAYPASAEWVRPPHIHFKITHRFYTTLITQMYFPDHPLNTNDLLFRAKNPEEQALMIARKEVSSGELTRFEHTIVLKSR